MYSAHHHKRKSPSATLLTLPSWRHTPYLSRNLQTNYAQKLTSIPYYPRSELARDTKYDLDIYLVANQKALTAIDPNQVQTHLENAIRQTYGALHSKITITTTRPDPTSLDSHIQYNEAQPTVPVPPEKHTSPTYMPHHQRWDPEAFIYTDGSVTSGHPIIGAAVVDPT